MDHTPLHDNRNASTFVDMFGEVKPDPDRKPSASHRRIRSELQHLRFDDLRKSQRRLSICDDLFIVIANNELPEVSGSPQNVRG